MSKLRMAITAVLVVTLTICMAPACVADAHADRNQSSPKKVFLTFDDGPSTNNTVKILKMLKSNDMHATFYIVGAWAKKHPELIKKEYKMGNQIGVHSWSHNYLKIYKNQTAFFKDFDKTEKYIVKLTGEKPTTCRLPGGSNNSYLKRSLAVKIVKKLRKRGYNVVDWNAATNDAMGINYSSSRMAKFAISGIKACKRPVVLSHDPSWKEKTPAAIKTVIAFCKKKHYSCVTMKDYAGNGPIFIKVK